MGPSAPRHLGKGAAHTYTCIHIYLREAEVKAGKQVTVVTAAVARNKGLAEKKIRIED